MISVVMPAHNEEGYLEAAVKSTVAGLRDRGVEFEIIVCENGSTDRTGAEAASLAETYGEVRVLRSPEANYGRALRQGLLAARGEVVINFDVDLVDLEFVDLALPLMLDGADIVVGSKRVSGADDQRTWARQMVTAVFSAVLHYGFGLGISDTHGLKTLRRATVSPIAGSCLFDGDIFDTELVLRAERGGLSVKEVPVTVSERRPPRTSITARIPRSLAGLLRLRITLWRQGQSGTLGQP